MKRIRILHVAGLLLAVTLACSRDEAYRITGLLTDTNRAVPVAGAKVAVWTQKIESGVYTADYRNVGETVTGDDGRFAYALENATYTGVRLVFSKKGYFGWQADVNVNALSKSEPQFSKYQMVPKAWLKIRVRNGEPFDESDYFEYRLLNAYSDCEGCCPRDTWRFYGMEVDQVYRCMTAGHQDLVIQYSKRKNNVQEIMSQTFFLKEFDTTGIELIY